MSGGIITPAVRLAATKVGPGVYRKQILPKGSINYEGQPLPFDEDMFDEILRSFNEKAFDSVWLQLGGSDNAHNKAVEMQAGKVIGVEKVDDGMDIIVQVDKRADDIISAFPDCGISVNLEPRVRQDGSSERYYPWALQHVLLTGDPYVAGMRPWTPEVAAALSGTATTTDLSAQEWKPLNQEATVPQIELPDEVIASLRAAGLVDKSAETQAATPETPVVPELPAANEDGSYSKEALATLSGLVVAGDDRLTGEHYTAILNDGAAPQLEAAAALSAPTETDVKLSAADTRIAALEAEVASSRWVSERTDLMSLGIPPAMIDAAAPVLSSAGDHTVKLSAGKTADAKSVLRAVLLAGKGIVPVGPERGANAREVAATDDGGAAEKAAEFETYWSNKNKGA